jgi:transcriptional regulator with GAF, ATPase, and Fis domain
LFGHTKGSFTGAVRDHKGYFEAADGGTLFLDEIGDLPLDAQVRLLRVLQSKAVTRLGATKPTPVDVRIVAATHRDLAASVSTGDFREDLFHRLAVGILALPPLREREGDVPILVNHFMAQINSEGAGRPEACSKILSTDAKNLLFRHPWPGNVRELYHTLLRAALWSRGPTVEDVDIRAALLPVPTASRSLLDRPLGHGFDLEAFLDEIKTHYIRLAMEKSGGKKTGAARLLGFSNHQTLGNWMKRLGIEDEGSD